jgi:hypothetical protein
MRLMKSKSAIVMGTTDTGDKGFVC